MVTTREASRATSSQMSNLFAPIHLVQATLSHVVKRAAERVGIELSARTTGPKKPSPHAVGPASTVMKRDGSAETTQQRITDGDSGGRGEYGLEICRLNRVCEVTETTLSLDQHQRCAFEYEPGGIGSLIVMRF